MDNKKAKNVTFTTAKRALGLNRTYVGIAIVFTILALTVWSPFTYVTIKNSTNSTTSNSAINSSATNSSVFIIGKNNKNSGIPLLAVPLQSIPAIMLASPVLLLFVYDKNNGVLEYLLSLGLNSRDIYMRYLKAALLLVMIYVAIFTLINISYSYVIHGAALTKALTIPLTFLVIGLAITATSLMIMCMLVFSSLQKTRAGSNQPLAAIVGWGGTLPAYLIAIILPFGTAIYAMFGLIIVLALISITLLSSSKKLIRNEKLLP